MHANFKTQYHKHQKGISIFGQQQAMLKMQQDIKKFSKWSDAKIGNQTLSNDSNIR